MREQRLAQRYGSHREQRAQSKQMAATETTWGRMTETLEDVAKERRGFGGVLLDLL